jgi:hypothetical protein
VGGGCTGRWYCVVIGQGSLGKGGEDKGKSR